MTHNFIYAIWALLLACLPFALCATTEAPVTEGITVTDKTTAGEWEVWTDYSDCSVSCGSGTKTRTRTCKTSNCVGDARESTACDMAACPDSSALTTDTNPVTEGITVTDKTTAGEWGVWRDNSDCSVSCGSGTKAQIRSCLTSNCVGDDTGSTACGMAACPADEWGEWKDNSDCSVSCGSGTKAQNRTCKTSKCVGDDTRSTACDMAACPDSSSLKTDTIPNTGCEDIDTCIDTLKTVLGTSFMYSDEQCAAITAAMKCYDIKLKNTNICSNLADPFAGKNFTYSELLTEFTIYCSATGAATKKTGCTMFTSCFGGVKLPPKANDLMNPDYWCSVIQAGVACDKKETATTATCTATPDKSKLNTYCPTPVDVLSNAFDSNPDPNPDSSGHCVFTNMLTIVFAVMTSLKIFL